jgi:hypothetical protein
LVLSGRNKNTLSATKKVCFLIRLERRYRVKFFLKTISAMFSQVNLCIILYNLGCGVAQLVVRRLDVWQARVRFLARHPREVFPTELTSDEEMER